MARGYFTVDTSSTPPTTSEVFKSLPKLYRDLNLKDVVEIKVNSIRDRLNRNGVYPISNSLFVFMRNLIAGDQKGQDLIKNKIY